MTAETGERMTVCFGDMEHSPEDVTYYSVSNKRAMTVEDLPAAARKAMDQCAVRTWYVIHSEGRQYLYCNGFPWRYAWYPAWEDGSWRVKIRQLKKQDAGYILLTFPDNAPLNVTLEGEPVRPVDILG